MSSDGGPDGERRPAGRPRPWRRARITRSVRSHPSRLSDPNPRIAARPRTSRCLPAQPSRHLDTCHASTYRDQWPLRKDRFPGDSHLSSYARSSSSKHCLQRLQGLFFTSSGRAWVVRSGCRILCARYPMASPTWISSVFSGVTARGCWHQVAGEWLRRSVLTPVIGESRIQLLINGRCFVSGSWIRLLGAGPSSEPRLWLSSVACQGRSATGSACGRSTLTRSSGRRIRHLRGRARCGCQPVESELADTGSPLNRVDLELANKWSRKSHTEPG
jgi:hypothetical protein